MENNNFDIIKENFNAKNHDEIIEMFDEIKEFEDKNPEYYIETDELIDNELIDLKHKQIDFIEPNVKYEDFVELSPEDIKKSKNENKIMYRISKKLKKLPIFRLKRKRPKELFDNQSKVGATFHLRLNDNGQLENIDLISKTKKKSSKKSKIFKKISLKVSKNKKEKDSEKSEAKGKLSKLKKGFGKIGKLKRVIPNRKSSKKSKETKEE